MFAKKISEQTLERIVDRAGAGSPSFAAPAFHVVPILNAHSSIVNTSPVRFSKVNAWFPSLGFGTLADKISRSHQDRGIAERAKQHHPWDLLFAQDDADRMRITLHLSRPRRQIGSEQIEIK